MHFSADFYKNNRNKLCALYPDALIVLPASMALQRNGDVAHRFRQDSSFLYFTGLQEPSALLLLNTKSGEEYLALPDKTAVEQLFDGVVDTNRLRQVSGIGAYSSVKQAFVYIAEQKSKGLTVFMPFPPKSTVGGIYTNPARRKLLLALKRRGIAPVDCRESIAKLRMVKEPSEITAIEQAIALTQRALAEAHNNLPSESEQTLLRAIDTVFAREGVTHAYEPIIASANNATVLHYENNDATYKKGSVVLFDVGAEYCGYAADISRTFVYGENKRAQDVIDAVTSLQAEIIARIKPGVTWQELSIFTETRTAKYLQQLGLDHTKPRYYLPHAFGHFLGLDVHDVGDYSAPLAAGMVLTVEPGIYIGEEQIGVRVEDDILVTETGSKML